MTKCDDCGTLAYADKNNFCFSEGEITVCTFYAPLEGEGVVETITRRKVRRACEECDRPADYKVDFLLKNYRSNPASKGYRRDDCSRCSDLDMFACEEHKYIIRPYNSKAYSDSRGWYPLKNFPHMGLYWKEVESDD